MSPVGNGGVIITKPDSPIDLKENISLRSATSITITWSKAQNEGGS